MQHLGFCAAVQKGTVCGARGGVGISHGIATCGHRRFPMCGARMGPLVEALVAKSMNNLASKSAVH